MAEYLYGPDGIPLGPELDALPEDKRDSIRASADFFLSNAERMRYFAGRVEELGKSGADTLIVLIDVDDPTGHGRLLADLLMPGHDWQQYRDRGETPVARGLAAKKHFPDILTELGYGMAAQALARTDDMRVLVLHAETVHIVDARYSQES